MYFGFQRVIAAPLKAGCGFAILVCMTLSAVGGPEPSITIRISTHHSPTLSTFTPIAYFKKRVEEISEGGINVEIYDSGKLYSDTQVRAAVSAGAIEMGIVDLSRYSEAIPAADAFQLPFVFNSETLEQRATVPGSEIRALIDDAILAGCGVRVLWWTSLGQTVIGSKGLSVANPEKLAGKAVRTIGPTTGAVVAECGGSPIDVPAPETDKALGAHKVDMAMTEIATVLGRRLWRYIDTVTRTNHSSVQFVAVINTTFWGRLTPSQKVIIETAAQAADAEAHRVAAE